MKQHITIEQLSKLTDKQQIKLQKWWMKHSDNHSFNEKGDQIWDSAMVGKIPFELPLLTIGQMIEFLDDLDLEVCISKPHLTQYDVSIYDKYTDKVTLDIDEGFYQSEELCDALWEAVKEKLNKD